MLCPISCQLFQSNYCNSVFALSVYTETEGFNKFIALEMLMHGGSQRTRALTVNDAHGGHRGENGVVDVLIDHEPRVVADHTAHVDLGGEGGDDGTLDLSLADGGLFLFGLVLEIAVNEAKTVLADLCF